jgi:tetratricopeptide (TPR) repeat protein
MYSQAIETFRLLQNRRGLGRNYRNLAEVERLLGRFDVSADCLQRSIDVRHAIGDRAGEARSCLDLVEIHAMMGDWKEAQSTNERALEIAREIDDAMLILEGSIRTALNRLSMGENPADVDLGAVGINSDTDEQDSDLMVLWFTLCCRHAQLQGQALEAARFVEAQQLIGKLEGVAFSRHRCLLSASLALVAPDRETALTLLEPILEETDLPPGVPLDMVISARASLEPGGSKEREIWEERAVLAVEERAGRILRAADRRRFLRARLGRIEE